MNLSVFNIATINVFPAANSNAGGQLTTEFNLRSRESIAVGPTDEVGSISYFVGPSYVHSQEDFKVEAVGSATLRLHSGAALVCGHYFESTTPIDLDMIAINEALVNEGEDALQGNLSIGLRAAYSAESTMRASLLVEESSGIFTGIQVVILPSDQFITPLDSPKDSSAVTAHIKLADFKYGNGTVAFVTNNYPKKCTVITSDRVDKVTDPDETGYVTKSGLNPNFLYIMAGKSFQGHVVNDSTWCDARDSLMVWDNDVQGVRYDSIEQPPGFSLRDDVKEAKFLRGIKSGNEVILDSKGPVSLVVPHKQLDGMQGEGNREVYYAHKFYPLPVANYATGESGIVGKSYTDSIKLELQEINNYYGMARGKQLLYIPVLDDRSALPPILETWTPGDYVMVGQDNTVYQYDSDSDVFAAPTTLYVTLPGIVETIISSPNVPNDAVCLGTFYADDLPGLVLSSSDPYTLEDNATIRGRVNKDYFKILDIDEGTGNINTYYYLVNTCVVGSMAYTDPILLTSNIRLATTDTVGGFLNVDETAQFQDGGYVIRDDQGYLRLLDYSLLRTDGLSYQLGQDIKIGQGLTISAIQEQLNDYVNERIAFANSYHAIQAANSSVNGNDRTWIDLIRLTITLPDAEESDTDTHEILINGIDSRFGTAVLLKLEGNASSNVIVNVSNCARIRIDSNIGGNPTINLNNCCLYYDSDILNRVNTIDNLSLWYDGKYDTIYDSTGVIQSMPPNIFVDGNTVTSLDPVMDSNDIDFWSADSAVNDNHYSYGLRSVAFDRTGSIVAASIFIRCTTTANIQEGFFVAKQNFVLPHSAALDYPTSRLLKPVKITGDFVHSYTTQSLVGTPICVVIDNKFTALSGYYNPESGEGVSDGYIYIYQDVKTVDGVVGVDMTGAAILESNGWHIFSGGVVG